MPGEGSVFRRADGKWIAQLSKGGRESRNYRTRTCLTRTAAVIALDALKADQRAGLNPTRLTTGDFLDRWVRDVRDIRPTTRHGYEAVIRYHLQPTIGDVRLAALTPSHVEQALAALAPRMSAKSLRNVHVVLRRALVYAVRAGLMSRNVAGREFVDAPKVPDEPPKALTHDEVGRLLEACRGDRMEALLVTAVGTGLRQGELLGLAWEDVDLDVGRLHVRLELVYRDGTYHRERPKTDRSRRTVPLAPAIVDALRQHRERLIADGFVPTATGPVFTNRSGGPLSGSWLTHRFYDLLAAAGIERLPFKNLRTTFATRLFDAGVSDRRVADLLGHTRTTTTHGHYISTAGSDTADAVAAVEALVDQSRDQSRESVMGGR